MIQEPLRSAFEQAMAQARASIDSGHLETAFECLERAHVLGQWHVGPHVRVHLWMLRIGWRRRDAREIVGQLVRIPAAVVGSGLGRVPQGNTGGANVSALRPMPIEPELLRLLASDERSSRRMRAWKKSEEP